MPLTTRGYFLGGMPVHSEVPQVALPNTVLDLGIVDLGRTVIWGRRVAQQKYSSSESPLDGVNEIAFTPRQDVLTSSEAHHIFDKTQTKRPGILRIPQSLFPLKLDQPIDLGGMGGSGTHSEEKQDQDRAFILSNQQFTLGSQVYFFTAHRHWDDAQICYLATRTNAKKFIDRILTAIDHDTFETSDDVLYGPYPDNDEIVDLATLETISIEEVKGLDRGRRTS